MSVVFPIPANDRFEEYALTAGQILVSVPFPFQDNRDIAVTRVAAPVAPALTDVKNILAEPTDYELIGAGISSGGFLTLRVPGVLGEKLHILGLAVIDRVTAAARLGKFSSEQLDDEFDRGRIIDQELRRDLNLTWRSDRGSSGGLVEFGTDDQVLGFDNASRTLKPRNLAGTGTALFTAFTTAFNAGADDAAEARGLLGIPDLPPSVIPAHVQRFVPQFAIGANATDILTACNAAAELARVNGGELHFAPYRTYDINGYISVKNGVKSVTGTGLIKRNGAAVNPVGLLLAGIWEGETANVDGCAVTGLRMDANGGTQSSSIILGSNSKNCLIADNRIIGMASGFGINISGYKDRPAPFQLNGYPDGNVISRNQISGVLATAGFDPGWYGIGLSTYFDLGAFSGAIDKWKADFAPLSGPYPGINNIIANNTVIGGTYSISMSGSIRTRVHANFCFGNTRNISCQNGSTANMIDANQCYESVSSGITLGYAAASNVIDGNWVYGTGHIGESLLQAYLGSKFNRFTNNKTFSIVGPGPINHLYFGPHGDGNTGFNNHFFGYCQKAYMSAEPAWNGAAVDPQHHYFGQDPLDPLFKDWANASMSGVEFLRNTINGLSNVPAIHLGQTNGPAVLNLTATRVTGNTVVGNSFSHQLKLYEQTAGTISAGTLKDNDFDGNALVTRFSMPRGRAHWITYENNVLLNGTRIPIVLTANSATPSVAHGETFRHANTIATNVTDYWLGETAQIASAALDGHLITIRMDINTTLIHNAAVMNLKGAVNAVGTSDRWVTLRRNTGRWDEMSRNF